MKLIDKKIVTVDLSVGSQAVVENISQHVNVEGLIISCDTQNNIVFLSQEEIKQSIETISPALIEEFNKAYSIDEDIHDCIEKDGLMDDIVFAVLKNLNIKQIKYFSALQDECELILMHKYQTGMIATFVKDQTKSENTLKQG